MTSPAYCYPYPHPAVTTDVVLFSILRKQLRVLLIRRTATPYSGSWALPGGFLKIEEDLETCARRELAEETGLQDLYLEQLYTFGQPERDPRERVISVCYLGLAPEGTPSPRAASDAAEAAWFPRDQLPALAFDHDRFIALAYRRLLAKLDYTTIGFRLLPETFTLGELQRVYETLRGKPVDKRNFRKWILGRNQLLKTGETRRNGSHRPARVYRQMQPERVAIVR